MVGLYCYRSTRLKIDLQKANKRNQYINNLEGFEKWAICRILKVCIDYQDDETNGYSKECIKSANYLNHLSEEKLCTC